MSHKFQELRKIKEDYVDTNLRWYTSHSTWPRIAFRAAGTLVILLSLGIPFLASAEGVWLTVGVPVASLSIAAISALNSFYGWQKTWEKRITAQLTLEGLIAKWEAQIAAAKNATDEAKAYEKAYLATERLIEATQTLTVSETSSWFANVKFPEKAEEAEK